MKNSHQLVRFSRNQRLGLLLVAAMLPGCSAFTNYMAVRNTPVAGPTNPVMDIGCFWQQGEGRDERGMPCRGFCGQIMFQTAAAKQPAIVNGSVTVYVFDDVGTIEDQAKPFQVFEFTPEEWRTFGHRTNLGMTYQLFIPYTRPGGREAECSLRVKFTSAETATPIYSHSASVWLRGANAANDAAASLDRKLMQSSPLFGRSPVLNAALADPANQAALEKLKSEMANPSPAAPAARKTPAPQEPQIQRLQALLEEASRDKVAQAGHERSGAERGRVQTANYETVDESP